MSDAIDAAALDRLREWGGDKLVRQMIRLYLENVEVRLGQINEGLSKGDLEETERGAHSLKSSAANVGAMKVNRLASALEATATQRDASASASLRDSLTPALQEAEQGLRALVEDLPE